MQSAASVMARARPASTFVQIPPDDGQAGAIRQPASRYHIVCRLFHQEARSFAQIDGRAATMAIQIVMTCSSLFFCNIPHLRRFAQPSRPTFVATTAARG
jgi:hypothetical protein